MPAESGIYWDSIDSQRSTSAGSSGECSSGSASRHYVDPWDLENYAYLRRHSVAGMSHHQSRQITQQRRPSSRLSRDTRARSDYWYTSREPGYAAPGFVEELYGPAKQRNNGCQYQRPIYEDDVPDYVAYPVYAPLSELHHGETEEQKRRHRYRSPSVNDLRRPEILEPRIHARNVKEPDVARCLDEDEECSAISQRERIIVGMVPPSRLDLNTYGHLKIDYTSSWNSLNRKISKS